MRNDFRHITIAAVLGLMLVLTGAIIGGLVGYNKGLAHCESVQAEADTITIMKVDTVTLVGNKVDTVIRIVNRPYPVAVHDTTLITHHTTDSIFISLPYQYRHYYKPDTLDIWYSGVDPKIDSARVYMHHTTEIIKQPYEVVRMPRLTLDAGVGAMWHDNAVKPYAIGKLSLNRPNTTFTAFGAINHEGDWAAGLTVTYRLLD